MQEKPACKFVTCNRPKVCNGFCSTHDKQWKRGWLLDDGTPTELYQPPRIIPPERKCLIKDCAVHTPLVQGRFCKKHINWFKTGACDEHGNVLRPVKTRSCLCLVDGCTRGRSPGTGGLCKTHYAQEQAGEPLKRKACKVCGKEGRRKKGFCERHYKNFQAGVYDINGLEIRDFIRRPKYQDNEKCRAKGCNKKPAALAFCDRHYKQLKEGWIDQNGRPLVAYIPIQNKGATCTQPKCTKPAACKLLCARHYRQSQRGTLGNDLKPPKTCSVEHCQKKYFSKGLCGKHYRQMRYMVYRPAELARNAQYREKHKDVLRERRRQRKLDLKEVSGL